MQNEGKPDPKKWGLTTYILLSLVIGLLSGVFLNYLLPEQTALKQNHWISVWLLEGAFSVGGEIFIRTLKMLVVPLVFISLICGTSSLGDPAKLGRVGIKTILFYTFTTSFAISVALLFAHVCGVGEGIEIGSGLEFEVSSSPPLRDVIINIFPDNPISAMAEGKMLQVIVFAILAGLSISLLGERAKLLTDFMDTLNEVVMKMITILMWFAPVGVFCVVAKVFAERGLSPLRDLALYVVVVLALLLFHAVVTIGGLLKVLSGLSPFRFFENIRPILMFAFSTSSSNATIPVTLETCEKRLGVDNSIASFTIPLGATVNMDGTAIVQGVATVFIANAAGLDLSFADYLMVITTATLASVGTAGVPGVGMITLAMVLRQVNLPEAGILLILPVDRILDMCRTMVNITGDAAVTCIVAKSENALNEDIYNEPLGKDYMNVEFKSKSNSSKTT